MARGADTIRIEIPELGRLISLMDKAGNYGVQQLKRGLNRGAIILQRAERLEAPRDTSNLAANINIIDLGPMETMISPKANYAEAVHKGRLPGSAPPVSALESWAARKGINPYAVQKSIQRKGTKPNPFVARALDEATPGINNEFGEAADRVAKYIAEGK